MGTIEFDKNRFLTGDSFMVVAYLTKINIMVYNDLEALVKYIPKGGTVEDFRKKGPEYFDSVLLFRFKFDLNTPYAYDNYIKKLDSLRYLIRLTAKDYVGKDIRLIDYLNSEQ